MSSSMLFIGYLLHFIDNPLLSCIHFTQPSLPFRITYEYLIVNYLSVSDLDMVKLLIEERGAKPDSRDPYDQTALMNCCKRTDKFGNNNQEVMRARRDTVLYLIDKGSSFTMENLDGMTAMTIAVREENHHIAMLLAQKGSPIMPLFKYMMKSKANQTNWVAGLVMTNYGRSECSILEGGTSKFLLY